MCTMDRGRTRNGDRRLSREAGGRPDPRLHSEPGGRGRTRGRPGSPSNAQRRGWIARHRVLSVCILAVLAGGLVFGIVIANALSDPTRVLQNRTTPPAGSDAAPPTAGANDPGSPTGSDPAETEMAPPDYSFSADLVNILVLGTDANAQRVKEGMNARTDCIMLISINVRTKTAALISIPRDTYVKIYSEKNRVNAKNRINAAFTFGGGLKKNGIPFAMNTVSQFLSNGQIPIDHYVLFDMDLVKDLIDAVGGVDVDVEFDATIKGMTFKKGMMHLNGKEALTYARDRHNSSGGDMGRAKHQQDVVIALVKKLKDAGNIVTKIPELYTAFAENIATSLTDPTQLLALAWIAKDMDLSSIRQHTIKGDVHTIKGSIVIANQNEKRSVVEEVFGISVPIDSSWTWSSLKAEIEAMENAGQGIVSKAQSLLNDNKDYYSATEAQALKNAIADWQKAAKENNTGAMAEAQQEVQMQYTALKALIDDRKGSATNPPTEGPTAGPSASPTGTSGGATASPAPSNTPAPSTNPPTAAPTSPPPTDPPPADGAAG